jgi:hypothetical protein
MNDWYIIVAILAIVIACVVSVINFLNLPTAKQIANVKEWLKYAVTQAEKELGSGTGQLKLRVVYDMAVEKFPQIAPYISFTKFSGWVDEALEWLNTQLESNAAIKSIVKED